MKWSWQIGTLLGIGVYMHATFLLLLAWVALSHWLAGRTLGHVLHGVVFILALFACVLLHEFGHALTARKYGIQTRDITLLPIGGVARLERMPEDPRQEIWVALGGPAVNVVIATLLFLWLHLTGTLEPLDRLSVAGGSFLERLMVVNVSLVVFNLIPAFPMDGGRVLRALLATRLEYTRATQIAAGVGQAMAFVFGFLGLFMNPFLLFIALFVWIGAAQESSLVQMRSALGGIPVGRAMITDYRALAPRDTLSRAVELILAGHQQDFPVVSSGRVEGVLMRADLLGALAQRGPETPVSEVMRRAFQVVDATEMLDGALARLQSCGCHTLPVTHGPGRLVGLVTMDNIGEFMLIQAAVAKAGRPRPVPA